MKPPSPAMAPITDQYLQDLQVTQGCLLAWQEPFQICLAEHTLFKEIIQVGDWICLFFHPAWKTVSES